MSKLFKLKEWLTLQEAVNHISTVLGEPVELADLYRFALDGHLKLSANFINCAKVKKVLLIKKEDIDYKKKFYHFSKETMKVKQLKSPVKDLENVKYCNVPINAEYPISKDYWLQKVEPKLYTINGLWDLTMIGAEKLDIEHQYQQETSGLEVNMQSYSGVYIQQGSVICQLHICFESDPQIDSSSQGDDSIPDEERRDFKLDVSNIDAYIKKMRPRPLNQEQSYPAERLGEQEHILVIRTSEVTRFIQSLEGAPQKAKPLHDKERTTLLILIGSLLKEQDMNSSDRGITPSIRLMVDNFDMNMSENTIRNILRQVADITA